MAFLVQIEFCVYGVMVKVSRRRRSLLNAALSRKQMLKIVAIILVLLGVTFYFLKLNAPEAKEWLKENRNKHALAGNRFAGTKDAIKFVDKLYELGAVKVVISKDSIYDEKERVKKEGGPYADAIVVTLPNSESERVALFKVFKNEANSQGMEFDPSTDVRNGKVFVWWD